MDQVFSPPAPSWRKCSAPQSYVIFIFTFFYSISLKYQQCQRAQTLKGTLLQTSEHLNILKMKRYHQMTSLAVIRGLELVPLVDAHLQKSATAGLQITTRCTQIWVKGPLKSFTYRSC